MKNKKVLIAVLVVLLLGGYAAYTVAMPKKKTHDKISGQIYILPKQFTLNLSDGRYATLDVALVLGPTQSPGTGTTGETAPPSGYGGLPEEAVVRDIITNIVTNQPGSALISAPGRVRIEHQILDAINKQTDVKVSQVLFPDVAVQ